MGGARRMLASLSLGAALILPVATIGCAHHYYRAYDPYYNDYHLWDHREDVYYQQWEGENHYNHRDFKKRKPDEQKQYWDWRHHRPDDHPKP
jgi:hypothetical protein